MGNFSDLVNRVIYGVAIAVVAITMLAVDWLAPVLFFGLAIAIFLEVNRAMARATLKTDGALLVPAGFMVISICGIIAAAAIRFEIDDGIFIVLWIAFGAVATDMFAYFGGRKFGRKSFFPKTSPNKTREGVYIGLGCGATVLLIGWLILSGMDVIDFGWPAILTTIVVIPIAAIAGDLLESKAKRLLYIKDFGTAFGKHGGVADRFDAMTAAFVAFYVIYEIAI